MPPSTTKNSITTERRDSWNTTGQPMAKAILITICLLLIAGPFLGWWFVWRPIPSLDGSAEIKGLASPVVVSFDSRDVPYIQASSDEDAYAAQGYVVARERMFQMEMLRLAAEGRMASVFGIASLPADRLMRTLGFERTAQEELTSLSPATRTALDAYCRGINSYIEAYGDRLPLEYVVLGFKPQPWRPVDSLAVSKYLTYELDESWKLDELRWRATSKVGDAVAQQLFKDDSAVSLWTPKNTVAMQHLPQLPQHLSTALSHLDCIASFRHNPVTRGSTACAIAPGVSQSGHALLVADKHSAYNLPGDWFLCSMKAGGTRMAGACIPGVPGIILGRNDNLSWSSSLLRADVQDLYVEHFDSEHGSKYKIGKDDKPAIEVREAIPVRFGQAVEHKITTTRHGPVLLRDKDTAVVLSWTGFEPTHPMIESIYRINHARSADELQQAVQTWGAAPQLFVYADRSGNTGARAAGLVPTRSGGWQGTTMAEGWTGKTEWSGYVPFSALPAQYNSAASAQPGNEGCIAAGQKVSSKAFLGYQWCAPYRSNRVYLALPKFKSNNKFTLADCSSLQSDEFNMLSKLTGDELKRCTEKTQSIDDQQQQALGLMRTWDGQLRANSPCASVFESLNLTIARRLVEPKLGTELTREYLDRWPLWSTFVEKYLREKPQDWLPPEERNFETFMITSFAKANTRLRLFFQSERVSDWQWQKIHQVVFQHPVSRQINWMAGLLNQQGPGVGGDANTVNACDVAASSISGQFRSLSGPVVRILIDMGDADKFYANIAPGQSGHLFSPYRSDQMNPWSKLEALPVAFSDARVEEQARNKLYISSGR